MSATRLRLHGRAWPGTLGLAGGHLWPLVEHTPTVHLHDIEAGIGEEVIAQ